jgi:hypothetical protein
MPSVTYDNIYYVDLSDDPDFTPGSFASVYPENCSFDDEISAIGNIAFQLSFGAEDQDGNAAVPRPRGGSQVPFIGPYRSYYRLRYGAAVIQTGIIVNTSTHLGDDYVSIAGKTWPHIWEKWQYPYMAGPRSHARDYIIGSPPAGQVYQVFNEDVITILGTLGPAYQNLVPYRLIFDWSTMTGLSGIHTNYQMDWGDMTTLFSKFTDLCGIGQGIEWWVNTDRKILWASPFRYGTPPSPDYIASFDDTILPEDLSFSNNGPGATHITGRGTRIAVGTQMASAYGYPGNQQQFSRFDADFDFGDVRNQDMMDSKTAKKLTEVVQPQHDIPIRLNPDNFENYWIDFKVGKAIHVNIDLYYHIINSGQQLRSYRATLDLNGNASVDWTLRQIYDVPAPSATLKEG